MKKSLFGLGLFAALTAMFFAGCGDGDDGSSYKAPETEKATINFDETKISCTLFDKEIHNGDSVELGVWRMDLKAIKFESGNLVFWSINGKEREPVAYDTFNIKDPAIDYCTKVDGKYQMKIDVVTRAPIKPAIFFDADKFQCFSYKNTYSLTNKEILRGDTVQEGTYLKFKSKDPDKIITSYSINDDETPRTEKIEDYGITDVSIKDIEVSEKIIWGDEGSGPFISIDISTRPIVKAKLEIPEAVICKRKEYDKEQGVYVYKPLANGADVTERDELKFYSSDRKLRVESYKLNDVDRTDSIYNGIVTGIKVSQNTVKDDKLKFDFKTRAAKYVNVKINENVPYFEVNVYGSDEKIKSTDEGINRESVLLCEGDKIEFDVDPTIPDVGPNDGFKGFSVAGQEFRGYCSGSLITKDGNLCLYMGRKTVPLKDGDEFAQLSK